MTAPVNDYEVLEALRLVQTLENKVSRFGMQHPETAQANMYLKKVRERLMVFHHLNERRKNLMLNLQPDELGARAHTREG